CSRNSSKRRQKLEKRAKDKLSTICDTSRHCKRAFSFFLQKPAKFSLSSRFVDVLSSFFATFGSGARQGGGEVLHEFMFLGFPCDAEASKKFHRFRRRGRSGHRQNSPFGWQRSPGGARR